ncbi:hypothetical protein [Azospirillum sp. Marseille-Q6669]
MSKSDGTALPSSEDGGRCVELHVSAEPGAEIVVLDGALLLREHAVGELHTSLPRGIYKLRILTGRTVEEQFLVLEDEPVERSIAPMSIASPIPLPETRPEDETHALKAAQECRTVHVAAGTGSSIFLFARGRSEEEVRRGATTHPAAGLELRTVDGHPVAEFEQHATVGDEGGPWAACRVELDPGIFRLRVNYPDHTAIEQAVVALRGWQTQLFLQQPCRSDANDASHLCDPSKAAVILARGGGFDPRSPVHRTVEVARAALRDRRQVLGGQLRNMLEGKFEDPMLGIFAGHLLLRARERDGELLRTVVGNLRAILGEPHPDVEALALAIGMPSKYRFDAPPMLAASWALVVQASIRNPDLVPSDRLSGRIASRIFASSLWLRWDETDEDAEDLLKIALSSLMQGARRQWRHAQAEGVPAAAAFLGASVNFLGITASAVKEAAIENYVKRLGIPRAQVEALIEQVRKEILDRKK